MKSSIVALLTGFLLSACVKTDTKIAVLEDPDWIRLEAPTGGEATDVAGNIDSTLFVATMFKIYRTTNQGKTWDVVWSDNTGPNAVLIKNDTLWHMRSIITSSKTVYTDNASDYSLDAGKTWKSYQWKPGNSYLTTKRQINQVEAADGTRYLIKENVAPDSYVNPSDIIRQTGNSQSQLRFPFKHVISSLLLDSKNRLYVAVSGTHIPETNRIYCCPRDLPSVVYVSKRPLP